MDQLHLREATLQDAEAICAIYNEAMQERRSTFETEPRAAADFETRIRDARFSLLVSPGTDGLLGWAGLGEIGETSHAALGVGSPGR
jgi:L-amino acid N-acyltransferase YncA